MLNSLIDKLIARSKKTPYQHIGDYMSRYWIVPYRHEYEFSFIENPLVWLLQRFYIAIRIHEIKRSDAGRDPHLHPWCFCTVILKNGYVEETPIYNENGCRVGYKRKRYKAGSVLFRTPNFQHRLVILPNRPATTLFITFKKTRSWGFYLKDGTYVPHAEYLKNKGQ